MIGSLVNAENVVSHCSVFGFSHGPYTPAMPKYFLPGIVTSNFGFGSGAPSGHSKYIDAGAMHRSFTRSFQNFEFSAPSDRVLKSSGSGSLKPQRIFSSVRPSSPIRTTGWIEPGAAS